MLDGLNRAFQTPLTVGIVLVLLLAVGVDFLLVLLQRLVAPWDRAGRRG
jgi:osmoprotectant transport system permease protein